MNKDKTIWPLITGSFAFVVTLVAAALTATVLGIIFVDAPLLDFPEHGATVTHHASLDIPPTSVYVTVLSPKPCTIEALILCSWDGTGSQPTCGVSDEFWDQVEARIAEQCGPIAPEPRKHGTTEDTEEE